MSAASWSLLAVYGALLLALAWPLGLAIEAVMAGRFRAGARLEAPLYRLAGVQPEVETGWLRYTLGLLLFNGLGWVAVYALQRLQGFLPLNPQGLAAVSADSAFNTAVSFATNTNWQGYGGETTMGHLTQMLGLAVQNFLSAATGIVVVIAMIRGFARHSAATIGNVWVDLTRVTLWILLPLSFVLAIFLVQQGVVQGFEANRAVPTLEEGAPQTLPMGPAASQIAIKQLGTNGGGFFNVNSAHPFENPTPLANLVELIAILLIPAALCFTFGRMVGDRRQGWAVFAAMALLFVAATIATMAFEQQGNPRLAALGLDQDAGAAQAGGNMEGKEVRFGIAASALWASATTAASNGSVNSMHDSYTPLGGLIPMLNMKLGEVVFGGVGSGLYGMLVFAIVAVFIAGLMIGRTPEYLGKKIETYEMKMASIAILVVPLLVLGGSAIAVVADAGRATIFNPGAHGFSEVLYAFSSAGNNNGSAFAGLGANTPFYNSLLGIAMWFGRFGVLVPVMAIAGALAAKKRLAATEGTLPTHGPLFVLLLVGTVLLVGLLNYVPALALGPVVEHLMLWSRR